MKCIDCQLPVLRLGDRHRTSDNLQCQQVKRWDADARACFNDPADVEDVLKAAIWFTLAYLPKQDESYDKWARSRMLNQVYGVSLLNTYDRVLHTERVLHECFPGSAAARQETMRRLVAEAAVNWMLGNPEACHLRSVEALSLTEDELG